MSFFAVCILYGLVLAVLLIGAIVLWCIAKPVRMLASKVVQVFGDTWAVRLIGLGMVAYVFQETVTTVCGVVVGMFISGLDMVMDSFLAIHSAALDIVESQSETGPTNIPATARLIDAFGGFKVNNGWDIVKSSISKLSFSYIFMAIALWVAIGQSLSYKGESNAARSDLFGKLWNWFTKQPKRTQDLLLWVTLAMGTYLSLAAIIATSELKKPEAVEAKEQTSFDTRLAQILDDTITFDKDYPEVILAKSNILPQLEAARVKDIKAPPPSPAMPVAVHTAGSATSPGPVTENTMAGTTKDSALPANTAKDPGLVNKAIDELSAVITRQEDSFLQLWRRKREETQRTRRNLHSECKKQFEQYASALNPLSRSRFATDLLQFASSRNKELLDDLGTLKTRISYLSEDINSEARFFLTEVRSDTWRPDTDYSNSFSSPLEVTYGMRNEGNALSWLASLPQPSGASVLGPFEHIAKWLVEIESLALTLVTGMLGFGILGAAISSFVKQEGKRAENDPLVTDLASVIIRGVSAAVIVFLSVKGGLAVFSSDETEPNAYVLFFTCLVGAVFSENIWAWAKDKLLTTFKEDSDKDEATKAQAQAIEVQKEAAKAQENAIKAQEDAAAALAAEHTKDKKLDNGIEEVAQEEPVPEQELAPEEEPKQKDPDEDPEEAPPPKRKPKK